jgi:hypothetical protein
LKKSFQFRDFGDRAERIHDGGEQGMTIRILIMAIQGEGVLKSKGNPAICLVLRYSGAEKTSVRPNQYLPCLFQAKG